MKDRDDFRPLSLMVGAAFFMEQLDATIIAPAIPLMAASLGTDPMRMNLTMTVYLLCAVIVLPVSGALADRFGTQRVFRWSVALFTASSLLCALAGDLLTLVAARALQGASGALMIPVGRIAIVKSVKRQHLVAALAWMITLAMVAPILGPPLGGLIATYLSWHWIFLANLPIGLLGWWLAPRIMPQLTEPRPPRFDAVGWLLLALGLAALVFGLEISHQARFPTWLVAVLWGMAACAGLAYVRWSRGQAEPLLDFSLLRTLSFQVSFVGGTLYRVGYGALPFLLPLALQLGLGFSPVESGLALLGSAIAAMIMKTWTARILRRFGFRNVLIWNGLACVLGLAICALFDERWGLPAVLLALVLGGVARSIQFNALAAIAYADVPASRTAAATSLNTTFQQLAVTLGVALSVWVLEFSAQSSGRAGPASADFAVAFVVLAVIAFAAVPGCLGLDRQAGAALSGHR